MRRFRPWLLLAAPLLSDPANAAPADAPAAAAATLDTVLVTGSRSSTRTVKNSSTPIDVVSAQELVATGQGNLLDALQRTLPSLSQVGGYQSDQESLVRGYQLRNLSPGYTLVLINGKRRNTSAYVSGANGGGFPGHAWADLALIPIAAIDRVEVLRDGASAIYGSDAIAGVVNILLKTQASGGSASLESGSSSDGDGSRTSVRGNLGLPWGDDGFVNLSAERTRQHSAIRPLTHQPDYLSYPAIGADGRLVALGSYNSLPAGATRNPAEASRDAQANRIYSSADYALTSAAVNAGRGLGDALQVYVTGTASDRTASAAQNFRQPATIFGVYDAAGVLAVWPDGFSPSIQSKEQQYNGTAGFKGALAGWDYDASVTYNRDTIRTYTRDSANFSLAYPGAPTDFYDGKVDYLQQLANLDLRRAIALPALASPVELSAGLEYQHEDYRRAPGQWESYTGFGAAAFIGFAPADAVDATRNSKAAYLGASANLTERWFVDAAVRYEDHSDFGDVTTGRLSTRLDVNDSIGVRATVSNGFHAPGLAARYYQVTGNCPCGTTLVAQVDSPVARALGASDLHPEKARNYSVGVTFDPVQNVHAAVDVYQIDIRDQLGQSSQIGYNALDPANVVDYGNSPLSAAQQATIDGLLGSAGIAIPSGEAYYVSYFTNIGDTRTRGVEFTLEATQDTDWGRLRYTYAANAGRTEITQVRGVPGALQGLPNIGLLTETSEYALRYRSPTYTQVAGVSWSQGRWSANLNLNYLGPLKRLTNGQKYQLSPVLVSNLSGSYTIGNGWSVDAGVDNLGDKRTRKIPEAARNASQRASTTFTYEYGDVLGTVGTYWFGRINYRF
ncbi:TonB-dependent receptor plug domain-containing protein [Xanthomonas hortorum pv. vitians]|uniref:TonB-dependent receptor n=1 Tax=Xanthomonas hortorum pv. vitians TaxID=83224 RepID=A0A6V7C0S8_9XANT|nr:TonB-dependent receptor [Xanthomonas hortorum]APP82846.1 TonB-dependent receptor [Xanthomonas hortorum pv. gardneri]ASW47220.1 TonB-dependent receptor [Xanthomonas hortorum]MCC8494713.1 TonB-dependent receptor [Xanthomonas hortorum pv. gardneri]MCE4279093.1 TonB-dependent receptor [Xanthomonas hortorum pv. vitians]MCE4283659.1 TonB-dependent receptor [Xanthomonas hortorum pv. vitians]